MNIAAPFTAPPLTRWMNTLVDYVRSGEPDLTNRQMALLLVVGREGGLHTVRGLAARLGVSKPVVTRALNSLTAFDMVARRVDERDDTTPESRSGQARTEGSGVHQRLDQQVELVGGHRGGGGSGLAVVDGDAHAAPILATAWSGTSSQVGRLRVS